MGRRTAAVLLALAVTACGGSSGSKVPALVAPAGAPSYSFDLVPTDVVAVGLPPLAVDKTVTIDGVAVSAGTGSAVLIRSMVSFVPCDKCPPRKPSVGYPTVLGGRCTDVWPTRGANGLGPTYRTERSALHKHEQPSVIVYVKAPAVRTVIDKVVVVYRDKGKPQILNIPVHLELRPKAKGARTSCEHGSIWFGGEDGADKVVPL